MAGAENLEATNGHARKRILEGGIKTCPFEASRGPGPRGPQGAEAGVAGAPASPLRQTLPARCNDFPPFPPPAPQRKGRPQGGLLALALAPSALGAGRHSARRSSSIFCAKKSTCAAKQGTGKHATPVPLECRNRRTKTSQIASDVEAENRRYQGG